MDKSKSNIAGESYPAPDRKDIEQPEFIEHEPAKKAPENAPDAIEKNKKLLETDLSREDPALRDHEPDNSN